MVVGEIEIAGARGQVRPRREIGICSGEVGGRWDCAVPPAVTSRRLLGPGLVVDLGEAAGAEGWRSPDAICKRVGFMAARASRGSRKQDDDDGKEATQRIPSKAP